MQVQDQPLSKNDAELASALLLQMRQPEAMFSRVSEHCLIGEGELVRQVEVTLSKEALGRDNMVTDLVHPMKGSDIDLRIVNPDRVQRMSHSEHARISQNAILFRINSVVSSVRLPKPQHKRFAKAWAEFTSRVLAIPQSGPEEARAIYVTNFDEDLRFPKLFSAYSGLSIAMDEVHRLNDLCKRLVDRYMLLVTFRPSELDQGTLRFEYRHGIQEQRFVHGTPRFRAKAHLIQYADQEQPHPRRRIHYGSVPVSFRAHLPWAKRCSHYSFSLEAGAGYFLAFQRVLEKPPRETPRLLNCENRERPRYSITSQQGRRLQLFMQNGRFTRYPLYIAVRHEEIPGRSTARAFRLAWFVTLILATFGVQSLLVDPQQLSSTASLFVAVLALTAFVSAPQPGPGVMGYPILARFTPVALGFCAAAFALWLGMRGQSWVINWSRIPAITSALRVGLSTVAPWGWLPPTVLSILLAVILSVRRWKISNRYLLVQKASANTSANFFLPD